MLIPPQRAFDRAQRTRPLHGGVTLVELIVSIALLGLLAGIVGLATRRSNPGSFAGTPAAQLAAARREALRTGLPVSLSLSVDGHLRLATALPDGSVLADSALGMDRLSGSSAETAERRYARAARDVSTSPSHRRNR